jgi:two-component system, LytTR family, response regulator
MKLLMMNDHNAAPEKSDARNFALNELNAGANGMLGRASGIWTGDAHIPPPSVLTVYLSSVLLLLAAYSTVFELTMAKGWADSITIALSNVVPLALLAAATYAILKHIVLRSTVLTQMTWHVCLGPLFALMWYSMLITIQALIEALSTGRIEIGRFSAVAFVWQMFQGLVLYALVAATGYALRGGRATAPVRIVQSQARLQRYLTKQGDELVPVSIEDIVLIRGAQDYAEVATADGRAHLVRMTLAEFEERLPDDGFVRIHRSTIINIAHLGRAEPIGSGRMALHLAGGHTVEASRNGAQAIRNLVI